uniref:Uncharacterized protein n=1 Tax=Glycine max TaxID=3847 RepID=K7M779_SOYBN
MAKNRENAAAGANPIHEKRKYTRWTEEEHRQFLRGVEEYGKSNLTDIAKNVVVTKTPAQVASHAQKYFLRQKSGKRTRPSIHDTEPVVAQPQNIHDREPQILNENLEETAVVSWYNDRDRPPLILDKFM